MSAYLTREWLLAVACIVAVALLFTLGRVFPAEYFEASSISAGNPSFGQLSDRFTSLAESKGALYAYEILRRAPLRPDTDVHLLGHSIGDELYLQQGIEGIASCTQEFRNACSHSVVIGALQEYGANAGTLARIDDACKKAPGGVGAYTMCYHGLGHGVFAYFGYDLEKTVAFCKRMGTAEYHDEQYTQCVGGTIMELMGGGGHDTQRWEEARKRYLTDDALAPCTNPLIPEKAKGYCYIYLTPRLLELAGANLANPDPSTFPAAFAFCDAIPSSAPFQRNSCFGGFGKEFVPLAGERDIRRIDHLDDAAYARAAEWCTLAEAPDGARACIHQALESVFWGGENDPEASFRFCSLSPLYLQSECYTRLAQAIRRYLPEAAQERWCGQLPESYEEYCLPGAPIVYE